MSDRRLITVCFCLALALAVIQYGLGLGLDEGVSASAIHRVRLPAVRRIFPIPTATPTATRTPRPTNTPRTYYLTIQNDLHCTLYLQIDQVGGPGHFEWSVPARTTVNYPFTPGTYDWYASSDCCGSGAGTKALTQGTPWLFFCAPASPELRQHLTQ